METDDANKELIKTIDKTLEDLSNIAQLEEKLTFELIESSLNKFVNLFLLPIDKKLEKTFMKKKKIFLKFLNRDENFIKENLLLNEKYENFKLIFIKNNYDNWNKLYVIVIAYLSYLKNIVNDSKINYKGMITKLYNEIK